MSKIHDRNEKTSVRVNIYSARTKISRISSEFAGGGTASERRTTEVRGR